MTTADFEDINDVIADFADPAGIVVVSFEKAPLIRGRVGLSTATLISVADAGHHPVERGDVGRVVSDAFLEGGETRAVYLRRLVLPATVEPDGNDPWWMVIGGKTYGVVSVEPWQGGEFWVATVKELRQGRATTPLWFGDDLVGVSSMESRQEAVAQSMLSVGVDATGISFIVDAMPASPPNDTPADFRAAMLNAGVIAFLNGHTAGGFTSTKSNIVADAYEAAYPSYNFDAAVPQAYAPSRQVRCLVELTSDGPAYVVFRDDADGAEITKVFADGTSVAFTTTEVTLLGVPYVVITTLLAAGDHDIEIT